MQATRSDKYIKRLVELLQGAKQRGLSFDEAWDFATRRVRSTQEAWRPGGSLTDWLRNVCSYYYAGQEPPRCCQDESDCHNEATHGRYCITHAL